MSWECGEDEGDDLPSAPAGRPHAGMRSGRRRPCPWPPAWRRASRRRSSVSAAESVVPGDGDGDAGAELVITMAR
uniref:Uncharacterized protein n=1 Tax=Arundo donax TaxID=35708 RepID=A0A0A9ANA7_ARUDO